MSTFGAPLEQPSDQPPRWVAVLVVAAALAGVIVGLWVFAALT